MSTDRNDSIVAGPKGDDRIELVQGGNPGDETASPVDTGGDPVPDCNETIIGTDGPDTLYGGKGADSIEGRGGDDVIYGDSDDPNDPPVAAREVFKWSLAPDPDDGGDIDDRDDLGGGFSQDTGTVTVDFSVLHASTWVNTDFATDPQFVDGIDTDGTDVDLRSGLGSTLNGADKTAEWGFPTFDGWVVDRKFGEANKDQVIAFLKEIDRVNKAYLDNPAAWTADSEPVKTLASATGADPAQVPTILEGFTFLPMATQVTPTWLGGAGATIKGTAEFLKAAGRIDSVKDDYSGFVNESFADAAK